MLFFVSLLIFSWTSELNSQSIFTYSWGKTLINEKLIFPENIFYVLFLWLGDDHGPVVIGDCSSFTALLITMWLNVCHLLTITITLNQIDLEPLIFFLFNYFSYWPVFIMHVISCLWIVVDTCRQTWTISAEQNRLFIDPTFINLILKGSKHPFMIHVTILKDVKCSISVFLCSHIVLQKIWMCFLFAAWLILVSYGIPLCQVETEKRARIRQEICAGQSPTAFWKRSASQQPIILDLEAATPPYLREWEWEPEAMCGGAFVLQQYH